MGSSNSGEKGRGLGELGWVEQVTQAEELQPPQDWQVTMLRRPPPPQFPRDSESALAAGRDCFGLVTHATLCSPAPL